jgi:hypothetical protein
MCDGTADVLVSVVGALVAHGELTGCARAEIQSVAVFRFHSRRVRGFGEDSLLMDRRSYRGDHA